MSRVLLPGRARLTAARYAGLEQEAFIARIFTRLAAAVSAFFGTIAIAVPGTRMVAVQLSSTEFTRCDSVLRQAPKQRALLAMTNQTPRNASLDSGLMSQEKQYELMYNDMVYTLTDRKRAVFDLTKWIVTLHGLIIGFASVQRLEVGIFFIGAPLIVGISGFVLNRSIQMEMESHRIAIARIRERVGGDFYDIHSDMVDRFLGRKPQRFGYWGLMSASHALIIFVSTLGSVMITYLLVA
jgi:hypothetical protein